MKEKTVNNFLKSNIKEENLVFLKIESVPRICCCCHCLCELWLKVNEKIYPQGPIEHESSAILTFKNEQIILEQHESGPELLTFIDSAAYIWKFVKFIISLSIDSFKKKDATRIKITKRIITTKQKVVGEFIFEIDSSKSSKEIATVINKISPNINSL